MKIKPPTNHPQVRMMPIADIKPNPDNPRTHSEKAILLLARGIERWGFLNLIIVDEHGNIVVVANGQDYADLPKLIEALITRHDAVLHINKDLDAARKLAIEIAALADLLSETGDDSAIEGFGICVDYPSDQVRKEASAMKEHWMRSKYSLSQIVFTSS